MKLEDRTRLQHFQERIQGSLHPLYPEEHEDFQKLQHQHDQEVGIQVTITGALILQTRGMDRLTLFTNLPDPAGEANELALDFTAPKGQGQDYLNQHFPGIPTEKLP